MPEYGFDLTGPIDLHAKLGIGTVTVSAHDGCERATVRLTARHPDNSVIDQIKVELRGSTLAVVGPRPVAMFGRHRDKDVVDAEIDVPSGTDLKVTTMSGAMIVTGRVGTADLASGSATITADTIDGDLRLRFGSSTARIERVTGDATIKSGSGDIDLGVIGGDVAAGLGSGRLQIAVARGAVRSRSGSGESRIGAAHGDIDVAAGSGRLAIGLPAGVSAWLDVHSGSGRFESDLPLEPSAASERTITVRARSGSGGIRVFRSPSDATPSQTHGAA